jgi:hypothetical protein
MRTAALVRNVCSRLESRTAISKSCGLVLGGGEASSCKLYSARLKLLLDVLSEYHFQPPETTSLRHYEQSIAAQTYRPVLNESQDLKPKM